MAGPVLQIGMLVGMTWALCALALRVGPRRSGLLLGLPSTTAMVLLGCAYERGAGEAAGTAELCLAGLVAAASAPLTFARAIGAGWGLARAVAAAVASYLAIATALAWLPATGPYGCAGAAVVGVALICRLARRTTLAEERAAVRGPAPRRWVLAARASVPVVYVLALRAVRASLGAVSSGRLITFPGASLAMLVATHVESGPGAAGRMATAMPSGSVGTLAFLTVFRFATPAVGLGWGTAWAYAAALTTLAAFDAAAVRPGFRRAALRALVSGRRTVRGGTGSLRFDPVGRLGVVGERFRSARRFHPALESLAG